METTYAVLLLSITLLIQTCYGYTLIFINQDSVINKYDSFSIVSDETYFNITGELVLSDPPNTCDDIANVQQVQDKIIVSEKGDCFATRKRRMAQNAGAKGIIIFSSQSYIGFMSTDGNRESKDGLTINGVEIANKYQDDFINLIKDNNRNGISTYASLVPDDNYWLDYINHSIWIVFSNFMIAIEILCLLYCSYNIRKHIILKKTKISMVLVSFILISFGSLLRIVICLDPTGSRGVFTSQESLTLYTISYPFNWTVNILLAFYWQAILSKFNSQKFDFNVSTLKIPCGITIAFLFILDLLTTIMRWYSSGRNVDIIILINAVVYILIMIPILFFFGWTSINLVLYLKSTVNINATKDQKRTDTLNKMIIVNILNCIFMMAFLLAVFIALSSLHQTPIGWMFVKILALSPITGIGVCQALLFHIPDDKQTSSNSISNKNTSSNNNSKMELDCVIVS
jgi:hypothetical protein